ncbi:MAG: glycoside hydrolase family 15 protein [Parcubacteria group bacterium]|nr:glycoside hydrolase family 15 protein [Parcubacteria group bacterium]
MSRSLVLGNGKLLISFDQHAQVRDFYYPHVGFLNHVNGESHKLGVWVDGLFSWLFWPEWETRIDYREETMVGLTTARNQRLKIRLVIEDAVYNEEPIYLRKITVENLTDSPRNVRLFFGQEFTIGGRHSMSTAYFDPYNRSVIHYRGRYLFLINGRRGSQGIDQYTVGMAHYAGYEGSWRDAEDGQLSSNPIEHGSVDSVVQFSFSLPAHTAEAVHYWIAVGRKMSDVQRLNWYVINRTPGHLLTTTQDFWRAWLHKENIHFHNLAPKVIALFQKSLLIIRTHVDHGGAILASADSDMLQNGKDTYEYTWPRDGALVAYALDQAGYTELTERFFEFMGSVIHHEGFLLHKYQSDRALGSSWHPWVTNGRIQLPIQEDETALVLWAFWHHYLATQDIEFVESLYNDFIKRAADFLIFYRDAETKLPKPSYELWEEHRGVSTFTTFTVVAALRASAQFAELLGKTSEASRYRSAAEETAKAIPRLFDETRGSFIRMLKEMADGSLTPDTTIDAASLFGAIGFGILSPSDPLVVKTVHALDASLKVPTVMGGYARYEGDQYYRADPATTGNPWIITTLWRVLYDIENAKKRDELKAVSQALEWVADRALPSGVLPEQIDPHHGLPISAAPLTWSHATLVSTVIAYLRKMEALTEKEV